MGKKTKLVYSETLRVKIAKLRLEHDGENAYTQALMDVLALVDELESGHMNAPFEAYHDDARTCAMCDARGTVIDVKSMSNGFIRRRRKCAECGEQWTTWEVVADK